MRKVVITGVETPLGRRVAAPAARASRGATSSASPAARSSGLPAGVEVHRVDLAGRRRQAPPRARRRGACTWPPRCRAGPTAATDDVAVARRVLDAAGDTGVAHLVRAVQRHRLRRVGQQPGSADRGRHPAAQPGLPVRRRAGRDRAPDRRVARRPPRCHRGGAAPGADGRRPTTATGWSGPCAPAPRCPEHSDEPPVQFVDLDDLAAACDLARRPPARRGVQRGARGIDPRRRGAVAHRGAAQGAAARAAGRRVRPLGSWGSAHAARAAALHAAPVGRGRRPPAGAGLGAASPTRRPASRPTRPARGPRMSPRRRQEIALGVAASASPAWSAGPRRPPLAPPLTGERLVRVRVPVPLPG